MQRDDHSIAGLLQALEHSLEFSDRLRVVVRQFIAAHHEGRLLDAALVTEYQRQLQTNEEQRARVQRAIAWWWSLVGAGRGAIAATQIGSNIETATEAAPLGGTLKRVPQLSAK